MTGPKESSQAVFSSSRNDMYVQMRNALANTVVDSHECSLSLDSLLHCDRQKLGNREEWFYEVGRQVGERFEVIPRDQQTMTGKHWAVVRKRELHNPPGAD